MCLPSMARLRSRRYGLYSWFVLGVLAGLSTRWAASSLPKETPDPNVVVLKSEKVLSFSRENMTLAELGALIQQQTQRTMTLDAVYAKDKTVYTAHLRNAPLTSVLKATERITGGVWERRSIGYHLRPMKSEEMLAQTGRMVEMMDEFTKAMAAIDPADPSLSAAQSSALRTFAYGNLRPPVLDAMPAANGNLDTWRVRVGTSSFSIYGRTPPPESRTYSRSMGWTTGTTGISVGQSGQGGRK
ncbi:MAG: hypothetical protein AAGU11_15025 [Syntrophobacteraceae bacterium]